MPSLLWQTESYKVGHTLQMLSGVLLHMNVNIQCVLCQRLPYLPIPCYTMHMCYRNRANFIASGWVDQKGPHSLFFFCLLSTFHAVICAKGRIKAALPWSQPSLFRLVKEGKLGGCACFGAKGLQDLLSGESSGFQRPRGLSRVAGKTQTSGFFLFSEMYF